MVLKNNNKMRYYEIVEKKEVDKILCSSVFCFLAYNIIGIKNVQFYK